MFKENSKIIMYMQVQRPEISGNQYLHMTRLQTLEPDISLCYNLKLRMTICLNVHDSVSNLRKLIGK